MKIAIKTNVFMKTFDVFENVNELVIANHHRINILLVFILLWTRISSRNFALQKCLMWRRETECILIEFWMSVNSIYLILVW